VGGIPTTEFVNEMAGEIAIYRYYLAMMNKQTSKNNKYIKE